MGVTSLGDIGPTVCDPRATLGSCRRRTPTSCSESSVGASPSRSRPPGGRSPVSTIPTSPGTTRRASRRATRRMAEINAAYAALTRAADARGATDPGDRVPAVERCNGRRRVGRGADGAGRVPAGPRRAEARRPAAATAATPSPAGSTPSRTSGRATRRSRRAGTRVPLTRPAAAAPRPVASRISASQPTGPWSRAAVRHTSPPGHRRSTTPSSSSSTSASSTATRWARSPPSSRRTSTGSPAPSRVTRSSRWRRGSIREELDRQGIVRPSRTSATGLALEPVPLGVGPARSRGRYRPGRRGGADEVDPMSAAVPRSGPAGRCSLVTRLVARTRYPPGPRASPDGRVVRSMCSVADAPGVPGGRDRARANAESNVGAVPGEGNGPLVRAVRGRMVRRRWHRPDHRARCRSHRDAAYRLRRRCDARCACAASAGRRRAFGPGAADRLDPMAPSATRRPRTVSRGRSAVLSSSASSSRSGRCVRRRRAAACFDPARPVRRDRRGPLPRARTRSSRRSCRRATREAAPTAGGLGTVLHARDARDARRARVTGSTSPGATWHLGGTARPHRRRVRGAERARADS